MVVSAMASLLQCGVGYICLRGSTSRSSSSSSRRRRRRRRSVHVIGMCHGGGGTTQASQLQWEVLRAIKRCGVIACLRSHSGDMVLDLARNVLDAGVPLLEITMNTPKAVELLAKLVQGHPSAIIGAGTVLNADDARNAELAGAKFLMSPCMIKDVLKLYKDGPILYVPGAMTPSEVMDAYTMGAKIIKVYPVSLVGGVNYIQALKTSFQHIPLIASQGITMDLVEPYLKIGASAVVLSDAIFQKNAMAVKDFGTIRVLASVAVIKAAAALRSISRTER